MDTSTWRVRALLEPRGFIRVIEFILAIVTFATTGGYNSTGTATVKCNVPKESKVRPFQFTVAYPFNLQSEPVTVPACNASGEIDDSTITMKGDFSPTSQWFMFVAVMAFLLSLAGIIYYVVFEAGVRQKNERLSTIGDFGITVVWAFLWLTAAASWAWGLGQVKTYADESQLFKYGSLADTCKYAVCAPQTSPDYGPLNASVAFAFLSFFVWGGNLWFVYKETPYHDDQQNLTPNEGMPDQQVPGTQP